MKYQQLENLESGWKWKYLVKKHREGELITCYIEASAAQEAVDMLLTLENEPVLVNGWIEKHINPALLNRMKQTIRARRKRHFTPSISTPVRNPSTWSLWSGSVWPGLRNGAGKPCRKRWCS